MYKQNLYLQTVIVILIKRVNQAPLLMKKHVGLPNKIGQGPRLLQLLNTSGRFEKYSLNKTYFMVKVIQDNYQSIYSVV
jgi:hypothetical protein